MTLWLASVGDLLDAAADGLICSANPQLNLSGGVGGALGLRYGDAMQHYLHQWLRINNRQLIAPGECVISAGFGSSFKAIAHAVGIDVFYGTSPTILRTAYENSFRALANSGCHSIAAACLACGYGRMTPPHFIEAITPLLSQDMPGIDRIELISTDAELIAALQVAIGAG